jgi:hypothetical protein
MELVKAELKCIDGGSDIKFMFNPSQLAFEGVVETSENPGVRTQKQGKPKVSFSNIKAYKITINNILFDTYEEGDDVVKKYIDKWKKAVEFSPGKQRPPVYRFIWGDRMYLRCCFIEKLNYKLTMFLPNGTPVRAVIDSLTLKEADEPKPNQSVATPTPSDKSRQTDNMKSKSKNRK